MSGPGQYSVHPGWSAVGRPARLAFHLRRHLAVWRQVAVQSVGREAQFRAQALTTLVIGVVQLGTALLPVLLMYGFTDTVRGWSAGQVVAVVGVFTMLTSLLDALVAPNLTRMSDYVAHGELDLVLMRPVSAQAFTLARWLQPAELGGVLTGLAVTIAGLSRGHVHVTMLTLLMAVGWLAVGFVLVTCLWANLAYLAFQFTAADPEELLLGLLGCGQYPLTFYPRAVRFGLLALVPVGVCTTLPVQAGSGSAHAPWLAAAAGFTIVVVAATRVHWRLALRRYASASS